jgi:hypothetical protein
MYGLARMCLLLACSRAWKIPLNEVCIGANAQPLAREDCRDGTSASIEYYAICDRIARGEKP